MPMNLMKSSVMLGVNLLPLLRDHSSITDKGLCRKDSKISEYILREPGPKSGNQNFKMSPDLIEKYSGQKNKYIGNDLKELPGLVIVSN